MKEKIALVKYRNLRTLMDAYELIKTVYFGGNEAVYICSKCGALHLRDQVCSGCGNDSGDDMVADVNVDVLAIQ